MERAHTVPTTGRTNTVPTTGQTHTHTHTRTHAHSLDDGTTQRSHITTRRTKKQALLKIPSAPTARARNVRWKLTRNSLRAQQSLEPPTFLDLRGRKRLQTPAVSSRVTYIWGPLMLTLPILLNCMRYSPNGGYARAHTVALAASSSSLRRSFRSSDPALHP